jgi:tetratricopeptide (TPR) repeat protein
VKEITLAVLLLYVNAFGNSDYQKGRLKSVTSSGQWVAVPRYQATTYIVKNYYTVELNDVIYIGNYERASRWNYNAKDFQSAQDVEVRIDGGHMFIKRPDGKDWKVAIKARIDPAEDSGGGQLTANPRKAASKHHDSALWLQEVGEFGRAIHEYETSLRLNPEDWETHYDFGVMLYERPSRDYALEEFRAVVKLAPKNSMAHCMVGMILVDKGELDTGIEELTTAIRLDSKLALAHFGYGTALEAKGELPQALEEYGRALHLERDFREAKSAMTRIQGKIDATAPRPTP